MALSRVPTAQRTARCLYREAASGLAMGANDTPGISCAFRNGGSACCASQSRRSNKPCQPTTPAAQSPRTVSRRVPSSGAGYPRTKLDDSGRLLRGRLGLGCLLILCSWRCSQAAFLRARRRRSRRRARGSWGVDMACLGSPFAPGCRPKIAAPKAGGHVTKAAPASLRLRGGNADPIAARGVVPLR